MKNSEESSLKPAMTRRDFLGFLIKASVAVTAIGFASAVFTYLWPRKTQRGNEAGVDAGLVSDLPQNKGKKVMVEGKPVWVINGQYGVVALSAVCTHLACLVDWREDAGDFFCPCHAAVFDAKGNVVAGPPPKPLPSYQVVISQGRIFIKG